MAPKESLAYDYKYWDYKSNNALPLELPQEPYHERGTVRRKKPATRSKINERNKTKSSMFNLMASLMFCFGIAILLVVRSAYIAEMNFKINGLDEQCKEAMEVNKEQNVRLLKSVNLETLEKMAFEELKMKYPDVQKGVVYIAVDPVKIIDNKDYRGYYSIADVQKKDVREMVLDYVGNLAGILKN